MTAELIFHGHSCFEIKGRDRILVDPFLKDNPCTDVGPGEVDPDIIAVTHGHGDHLGDAAEIARRTGAPVVCIAEIAWYLSGQPGVNCVPMNMGGTVRVRDTDITMVRADHSSGIQTAGGTLPGGQSAGFIMDSGFRVYHMGDTALFSDLKLYHLLYRPDVVLVPIGGHFTMGPKEGAMAVEWLGPGLAVPMHYDTWDVIRQDPGTFADLVKKAAPRTSCVIMKPGDRLDPTPFMEGQGSEPGPDGT